MTEHELERLLFDRSEVQRKIVIRRVGGRWLMACPLYLTGDNKPARLTYSFWTFAAALAQARMWVWK